MRVRPFFWCLLMFVCVGSLLFAASYQTHMPNILQLHILQQRLVTEKPALIKLSLTDGQGLSIENAHISLRATMTNMDMSTREMNVESLGHGEYLMQLHLFMAGPWAINVQALAEGFAPSQQNLYVQVE